MKLNTMKKLYLCLENKFPEIILDTKIAERALIPINRMLEMS
jgi:quinolinate synthase